MAWANKTGVAMTGSEVKFEIPDESAAIVLLPVGGDITLAWATGGATFPVYDGKSLTIRDANIGGKSLFLTGTAAVTVYCMYSTHRLEE